MDKSVMKKSVMKKPGVISAAIVVTLASVIGLGPSIAAEVQDSKPLSVTPPSKSRSARQEPSNLISALGSARGSAQYQALQRRLSTGWNTWDVHSVTTEVLLPDGLAIHVGLKHNTTFYGRCVFGRRPHRETDARRRAGLSRSTFLGGQLHGSAPFLERSRSASADGP